MPSHVYQNMRNLQHIAISKVGDYVIRQCTEQDLSEVILINWQTLPEHYSDSFYQNLLREAPESFLVAEFSGKVVGYIMCRIEYGFSTIKRFGMGKKGHIVSIG
ncbi:MAG: GNAT family N-acetyltransferase, partial [Nitrososphaerales archaeon]